jgi:hypothetical protein
MGGIESRSVHDSLQTGSGQDRVHGTPGLMTASDWLQTVTYPS